VLPTTTISAIKERRPDFGVLSAIMGSCFPWPVLVLSGWGDNPSSTNAGSH